MLRLYSVKGCDNFILQILRRNQRRKFRTGLILVLLRNLFNEIPHFYFFILAHLRLLF